MDVYSEYDYFLIPNGVLAIEPFDPSPCRDCKFRYAKKKEFLAHCSDGEHWTCVEYLAWRDRNNTYNEVLNAYKEAHRVY